MPTPTTVGKFVYLSYIPGPVPFDKAVIGYTDGTGAPGQTWTINPLLPNSVSSQPNFSTANQVALYLAGQLVAQYSLNPSEGTCWPCTNLLGPTGMPLPTYFIAYNPNDKAIVIMDQEIVM